MSRRGRTALFLAAAAGFAALFVWGLTGLPDFGRHHGAYGIVLNGRTEPERHVTNVPTAINFDYRALDTLGEEFILFAAAVGIAVTVRFRRDEEARPAEEPGARAGETSETLRLLGLAVVGPVLILGLYVVAHGHLTPGGGFQGGVLLAGGLLLVYLAGEYATVRRVRPWPLIEAGESAGAGGYALLGLAGLIGSSAFFANLVPLGPLGTVQSGGTIPLANLVVGLEVTAAFTMVFSEILDRSIVAREGP
jgi:multicomponent Na+:H+ antiporter subunit B